MLQTQFDRNIKFLHCLSGNRQWVVIARGAHGPTMHRGWTDPTHLAL